MQPLYIHLLLNLKCHDTNHTLHPSDSILSSVHGQKTQFRMKAEEVGKENHWRAPPCFTSIEEELIVMIN